MKKTGLPKNDDRLDEVIYDELRPSGMWGNTLGWLIFGLRARYDFDMNEQKPRIQKRILAMKKMGFLDKRNVGKGSRWIAIP